MRLLRSVGANFHPVRGRYLVHPPEESAISAMPVRALGNEVEDGLRFDSESKSRRHECANLASEIERSRGVSRVVQGFFSSPITTQEEFAFLAIPNCERPHAIEPLNST